jgi:hypothetical protein
MRPAIGTRMLPTPSSELADQVVNQFRQFQAASAEVVAQVGDVLNGNELKAFYTFAAVKNKTPEELLRFCITHYCPLEIILEDREDLSQ